MRMHIRNVCTYQDLNYYGRVLLCSPDYQKDDVSTLRLDEIMSKLPLDMARRGGISPYKDPNVHSHRGVRKVPKNVHEKYCLPRSTQGLWVRQI